MRRLVILGLLAALGTAQDKPAPAPHPSKELFDKGMAYLQKKRWSLAQKTFRKMLKKYPESPYAQQAEERSDDNCYLGTEVLWKSGPPSRRIDVAVMGDGFVNDASGQKKQEKWARLCVDVLWNEPSFSQYRNYFNIYFVRLCSLEEGVDPQLSPEQLEKIKEKNKYRSKSRQKKTNFSTALDAKAAGPQGQVLMDRRLVYKWLEVANRDVPGVADDRYVIAFAQFGRLGMGGGGIANVGRPDKSVTTHEFGHAFSRLLDEYAINPGKPRGVIRAANAFSSEKEPKKTEVPWAHFFKKRVKGVGIYEGGATFKKGVWRPAPSCAMNAAGATGFCPVCREQSIKVIYEYISPIEHFKPRASRTIRITEGDEKVLMVQPMQPYKHKLDVAWYVTDFAVTKSEKKKPVVEVPVEPEPEPSELDLPGLFDKPKRPEEAPPATDDAKKKEDDEAEEDGETDDPFPTAGGGPQGRPAPMWAWGGWRARQNRAKYKNPPAGKKTKGKILKAKGTPVRHVFDLSKLGPGNWRITCEVWDKTKWVVKDENHLLQERVTWTVRVTAKPVAPK